MEAVQDFHADRRCKGVTFRTCLTAGLFARSGERRSSKPDSWEDATNSGLT
jgi:hypothetical protein